MPSQLFTSTENNFTKGLITEATGLNFPENAATATSNTEFTLIGDVIRREGINYEVSGSNNTVNTNNQAFNQYLWKNAGGDGQTELVVQQIGQTLYFYLASSATTTSPISTQLVGNVVLVPVSGGSVDATKNATFADGNGYLFVYHSSCEPSFVTYNPGTQVLSIAVISVQVRDFVGLNDNLKITTRPSTLSTEHNYNIQNQGWTSGNSIFTTSQTVVSAAIGSATFQVASGLTIPNGTIMSCYTTMNSAYLSHGVYTVVGVPYALMYGTVVSYTGTTLQLNIYSATTGGSTGITGNPVPTQFGGNGSYNPVTPSGYYYAFQPWGISSVNTSVIQTWNSAEGNYPSNADVWWYFKDNTDIFNPATTQPSVSLATGTAPQGHFILPAFNMDRSAASGISGITAVTTMSRPSNGAWFQGRVWFTGAAGFQATTGDASFYTWTENIYFSQVVQTPSDFGSCYQTNDPTSENLFDILPTDGGVITEPGTGKIYKLFPISNGMIIMAQNGIWFLTGSTGIGFAANDYTITKLSSIKMLSEHSVVDVNGLPMFWNEEGIYMVEPVQNGSLTVNPITVGTILSFYNDIPTVSKQYARGAYDPINYVVQWTYRSTAESGIANRYQYDSILNYNTYNKSFFPYTVGSSTSNINGILYVNYPNSGATAPEPGFKYPSSTTTTFSYADEHDTNYVDWGSVNYKSTFTVGYKLHGQGIFRFQVPYVYVYSRNNGYAAYYIQGCWDYASGFDSNRWSQPQFTEINESNTAMSIRRHKIRGRGLVLQLQFNSVDGQPFDIMGWALYESRNSGA